MSYIVGQYNHTALTKDDTTYVTPIKSGTVNRKRESDIGGMNNFDISTFNDECITGLNLEPSKYYYFRCQIKRMTNLQQFSVKLINYDDTSVSAVEQYVKTVIIQGGDREEWVNVDFVFNPIVPFDTILFELKRTMADYREMIRFPKIAYIELNSINNLVTRVIGPDIRLLKIGVQSHPGLSMCINGEEIHISRTGIFEIKNGVIPVTFFSVLNAATENDNTLENWKTEINYQIEAIEDNESLTPEQKEIEYSNISSRCFFGTSKDYKIDPFTLDYMYNG